MKKALYMAAAAACALSAVPANAATLLAGSSIDFTGFFQALGSATLGGATSLDFVNGPAGTASPGVAGTVPSYGSGTGSFAGLSCTGGACGTISDVANFTVGAQTIANFFSLTGGNNTSPIAFDLTSIDRINRGDPNFLTFTASGNIRYDGFDPTPATFLFSAQGSTATSFSATAISAPVPEPAVWGLMLFGFAGLGYTMRRRPSVTRVRYA